MALPKIHETPNKEGDMQVVDVKGIKQLVKMNENIEKLTDSILDMVKDVKNSNSDNSTPENNKSYVKSDNQDPPTSPSKPTGKKPGSFTKGFVSGLLGIEDIVNYHTADDKEKIMNETELSQEQRRLDKKENTKPVAAKQVAPIVTEVIPATQSSPEPEKKQETITIGGQKLDPKNPKDAKIIEQINKQEIKDTKTEKVVSTPLESTTAEKVAATPTKNSAQATEKNTSDNVQTNASSELNSSIGKLQESFDKLAVSLNTLPNNVKSLEKVLQETFSKLDKTIKASDKISTPTRDDKGRFISNKNKEDNQKKSAPERDDKGRYISNKTMSSVNMDDKPVSASGVEPNEDSKKETDKEQDRELLAQAIADKLGEILGNSGSSGLPDIGDVIPDGKGKPTGGKSPGKMAGRLSKLGKFGGAIGAAVTIGESAYEGYSDYKDAEDQLAAGKITEDEAKTKKGGAVGKGIGGAAGGLAGAATGALAGAAIGSVVPVVGTAIGGLIGGALGAWGGSEAGKAGGEYIGSGVSQTGASEPILDPESAAMSASMEPSVIPKVEPAIKQKPGLGSSPMRAASAQPVNVTSSETKGQKLSQITNDNSDLKSSSESKQIIQPIISSNVTNNNNKDNYIPMTPKPRNDMNSIERYLDKVR